jgi:hypothetical protein
MSAVVYFAQGARVRAILVDFRVWFFCQFLTANAYLGLTFGTISGTGAGFLAPFSALVTGSFFEVLMVCG